MAWSKLYTAEADVPIGFQTVNQLRTNIEVHRDALAAEHATGITPGPMGIGGSGYIQPPWALSPYKQLGRHDSDLISKAVAYVTFNAQGGPYIQWANHAFVGVSRFSEGEYFLPLSGLTAYWGTATLYEQGDASDLSGVGSWGLTANVRAYYPEGESGAGGIFVTLRRRLVGTWELADAVDFSVTAFGKSN